MRHINDLGSTLRFVNEQIADLLNVKEKLEEQIMDYFNHAKGKTKTYREGRYRIEIKSPINITIDVKKYLQLKDEIPQGLDPVVAKTSYKIRDSLYSSILESASPQEKLFLSNFITEKYGKNNIKVGDNV